MWAHNDSFDGVRPGSQLLTGTAHVRFLRARDVPQRRRTVDSAMSDETPASVSSAPPASVRLERTAATALQRSWRRRRLRQMCRALMERAQRVAAAKARLALREAQ